MSNNIRTVLALLVLTVAVAGCAVNDADMGGNTSNERDEIGSMPGDVAYALRALPSAEVTALHRGGIPAFVRGNLGHAGGMNAEALKPALEKLAPVFRLKDANLSVLSSETDSLGKTHHKFQQLKDGMPVVGGELIVHVDSTGTLYAANSTARDGVPVSATPSLDAAYAVAAAKALPGYEGFAFGQAELKYVYSSSDNALHLAFEIEAVGARGELPARDRLFIDAHSGALAEVRPTVHSALNRKVYSSNNTSSLPGTLKRGEGSAASTDAAVNSTYDNVGATYNFYKTVFGRDSYNGSGAALVSSVHYGKNYDNAYWDGVQTVFGDGDGISFGSLTVLDITAHEITHAVTEYSANLVYQNEPGALNEAMSDILGAAAESYTRGGSVDANTWKIGEEAWTPGTAGDAMRYMNDPVADGQSKDYYPTRYTGTEDFGGVHLNSGIPNLAFKLLVTGGTHPRGRTSVAVTAVGMDKARAIFYRALTQYMTSTTNFAGTRAATKQAATELYGAAAATSVEQAWAAVGVGSAPTGGSPGSGTTPPPTSATVALSNGNAVSGIAGAANEEKVFTLSVPANSTNLKFQMSGGTGDADIYVKFGSRPTTTAYDYRPYLDGNNELVAVTTATAGTWYIVIRGYTAFTGISLVGSYAAGTAGGTTPSTNELQNGVAKSNLSGATGSDQLYTFKIPAGATSLTINMGGGAGDADLYVRYNSAPTTNAFDFRPYKAGNAETVQTSAPAADTTVYVMVRAYSAYSGVTLTATAQ